MPPQRAALARCQNEMSGRDPVLDDLVDRFGPARLRGPVPSSRRFENLARAITHQQLNGTAARTIWGRVLTRLDGRCTPGDVLAVPVDDLRSCGLSGSKTRALHDLATHVEDGRLPLDGIGRRDDDEVIRLVTAVWGLGRWSAHMFMMSSLGRLDVWPIDDFGVRKGFGRAWGLDERPSVGELEQYGERFEGGRSLVAWYCWAAADDPAGAV